MSRVTIGPYYTHIFFEDIDECTVGEDNCHSIRATCADVVGGQDSFTCTCITGYTGDGVTCSSKHHTTELMFPHYAHVC